MTMTILLLAIAALGLTGWLSGRARAQALYTGKGSLHSLPSFHGWYQALWITLPALLMWIIWQAVTPAMVLESVLADPAAAALPAFGMQRDGIMSEAAALAANPNATTFKQEARALAPVFAAVQGRFDLMGGALIAIAALAGGAWGYTRIRPAFPARTRIERGVMLALMAASLVAVLTTFGIIASLLFESGRFFASVSPLDFLTGTSWNPGEGPAETLGEKFGAVPLFWGTLYIGAIIAMIVAIPLGMMSAIFLTQYASHNFRKWAKPVLEILAGIPTVVYGYFAALTVAPYIRDFAAAIGMDNPSTESALAAGLVMGVMIIPFVSSMADDSIAAVPQAMRDGSLAMGATKSETIKRVLIPAALPGIVAGIMLAISRAIGETMIVVMAAGAAANLSANPLETMTTVTYQIVKLLTGDQEFDSPKTLSAFALGLVLFAVTLVLNIIALRVVKRFREAYD